MSHYRKEDLLGLRREHDALVGLDSDGCVFPTMELKQKQCFHAEIVRRWGLEQAERALRECAEFVNLRSKWRGHNRFPALLRVFDLFRERPDAAASGAPMPPVDTLRRYVESGLPLSNATLEQEAARTGDPELRRLLEWSLAVNGNVERTVRNVAPFRWVLESLELISRRADLIVVSQTPEEALVREWQEHGLEGYPRVIAGQELGTKAEHLAMAAQGRYAPGRVLMVGDAQGDLQAARAVGACFFPVNPGLEEESWKRFLDEAFGRFLAGTFAGAYEAELVRTFDALLPETPPWKRMPAEAAPGCR